MTHTVRPSEAQPRPHSAHDDGVPDRPGSSRRRGRRPRPRPDARQRRRRWPRKSDARGPAGRGPATAVGLGDLVLEDLPGRSAVAKPGKAQVDAGEVRIRAAAWNEPGAW